MNMFWLVIPLFIAGVIVGYQIRKVMEKAE